MPSEPQLPEEWSEAERWAWGEIRAGRIADFHKRYDKELDPYKPDGWDDGQKDRRLSHAFLVTILTEESFRRVISFKGVCINGACFEETVDLQHVRLKRQLCLEHCRFQGMLSLDSLQANDQLSFDGSWFGGALNLNGTVLDGNVSLKQVKVANEIDLTLAKIGGHLIMIGSTFGKLLNMGGIEVGQHLLMSVQATFNSVDLTGAKIGGQLSMIGSTFGEPLNMDGIEVGQHLFMSDKATFKTVGLTNAKIGGQLSMSGSTFGKPLNMGGIEVGQHFFMSEQATFNSVDLTGAKIGGELNMNGSTFGKHLNINGIEVGQHLLMSKQATFNSVNLSGAKIGGQLNMSGSTFGGELIMDGIKVERDFFARSTTFPIDQEVILFFSRIGSSLDLSNATIGSINLTGTTITGELCLGSGLSNPTHWVDGVKSSRLVLRNTTVGAIQDANDDADSWPVYLELEGFVYRRLGGLDAKGSADIAKRDCKWFIQWLERGETFSPQPYEQLADLLRKSGYSLKADAILYVAREKLCQAALDGREWSSWAGLKLLEITIGYGLGAKYFRVFKWLIVFTIIGFLVLLGSIEGPNLDLFKMALASFDQVLPVVTLNKEHEVFILESCSSWVVAYFYFQKLVGYVLGGFLVGGLAGLTQKS